MKKATLEKLEALHGAVADILADGLEACNPHAKTNDDGYAVLVGYDARLVGQAMSFLKDNDITVDQDTGDAVGAAQAALDQIRKKKRVDNDPFADIPHH